MTAPSKSHAWFPFTVAAVLLAGWVLNAPASAQTSVEAWPEANAFVKLDDRLRLYLVAAYAKGRETDLGTLDLAANLDISLKPIVREKYRVEDWQRSRFFWARIGYDHVFRVDDDGRESSEHRGMVNVFVKASLPARVILETRARADLRWIDGEYSTRYRLRLEATREFLVADHPVVPYLNAEAMYDTRYSGWSRLLVMAGAEFTVSDLFRFELYAAPQFDYLPAPSDVVGIGAVARFFF